MGICILIVGAFTGGVFLIQSPGVFSAYIKNDFVNEALKADVRWSAWDIRFGLGYLVCVTIATGLSQTRHVKWGAYLLIISSALFINTITIFVVPRIEKYSQGALIEFIESKKDTNCTIETAGFKSYAVYFYADKKLNGVSAAEKPHYVITQIINTDKALSTHRGIHELYRKNGWVFYQY